jgi:hypothetical protein
LVFSSSCFSILLSSINLDFSKFHHSQNFPKIFSKFQPNLTQLSLSSPPAAAKPAAKTAAKAAPVKAAAAAPKGKGKAK